MCSTLVLGPPLRQSILWPLLAVSPPVSEALRGGGEVSLPIERVGWLPCSHRWPSSPWCYQVLPRGIVMKVIIMINIISNITCTLLKYRVVCMNTRNVFLHLDIPHPTLQWPQVICCRQGTNTQGAQILRPSTAPCGRLLALLLYRWTIYNIFQGKY